MKNRLLSAMVAVPILLVIFVSQSLANSSVEIGDIQLALSNATNANAEPYQSEPGLSAPVAKGRRTKECRILRICD